MAKQRKQVEEIKELTNFETTRKLLELYDSQNPPSVSCHRRYMFDDLVASLMVSRRRNADPAAHNSRAASSAVLPSSVRALGARLLPKVRTRAVPTRPMRLSCKGPRGPSALPERLATLLVLAAPLRLLAAVSKAKQIVT